jgi:hypothetical protein
VISALTQREKLTEIVELPQAVHPWFVGVQFHPEFKSTPWGGHPLFTSYVKAALDHHGDRTVQAAGEGRGMKLCGFDVGLDRPFFLIAGPCVVESEQLQMDVAGRLKEITRRWASPSSSRAASTRPTAAAARFRGPGMERGLEILAKVKRELGVPVLTDVHDEAQIAGGGRRGRRAADAGLPVPADRLHPRRGAERQAGEHQEGPVPGAART